MKLNGNGWTHRNVEKKQMEIDGKLDSPYPLTITTYVVAHWYRKVGDNNTNYSDLAQKICARYI